VRSGQTSTRPTVDEAFEQMARTAARFGGSRPVKRLRVVEPGEQA